MKKHLFLICIAISIAFCSCRPYQAYVGPRQDKSAVAIVAQGDNHLTIDSKNTSESALLVKVDDMEVGSSDKGYPKKCEILPGKHVVEVCHLQKWNDRTNTAVKFNKHFIVTFVADAGQSYTIMPVTDPESMREEFHVIKNSTGERIDNGFKPLERQ